MRFFTACALLACALAAPASFAQLAPVQPGDVLVYERSDKPGPGPARGVYRWVVSEKQAFRVIRKPAGQMVLVGGAKFALFDPVTFSLVDLPSADVPNAAFPINIETDRTTKEYPTGQRWGMIITLPFSAPDGTCKGQMRQEIVAVSLGVVSASIDNGDSVDKAAINVAQEGRYNNCASQGAFTRALHYSPQLQVPTMIEDVTMSPGGAIRSGWRLVLREVRRAS